MLTPLTSSISPATVPDAGGGAFDAMSATLSWYSCSGKVGQVKVSMVVRVRSLREKKSLYCPSLTALHFTSSTHDVAAWDIFWGESRVCLKMNDERALSVSRD